ncbi:hypothetical protein YPPY90_1662, partial [Yersinia pestis PY-90]
MHAIYRNINEKKK